MPYPLQKGDKAIITSGPFEGKVGTIAAVDGDAASITVDVFARDTSLSPSSSPSEKRTDVLHRGPGLTTSHRSSVRWRR
jgi:ribosomal protein L24